MTFNQILRSFAFALIACFCVGGAYICAFACQSILHTVPGWEVVRAGVAFVGLCYFGVGLFFLWKAIDA